MPSRLCCDRMLLRLARWLRFIGYDVLAPGEMDDTELIAEAQRAHALLLTRDRGIWARRGVNALYIDSDELEEQLLQVVGELGLPPGDAVMSRCSLCNSPVNAVQRGDINCLPGIEEVPDRIKEQYDEFRHCPRCAKIYWRGSQYDKIMAAIEDLKEE